MQLNCYKTNPITRLWYGISMIGSSSVSSLIHLQIGSILYRVLVIKASVEMSLEDCALVVLWDRLSGKVS